MMGEMHAFGPTHRPLSIWVLWKWSEAMEAIRVEVKD